MLFENLDICHRAPDFHTSGVLCQLHHASQGPCRPVAKTDWPGEPPNQGSGAPPSWVSPTSSSVYRARNTVKWLTSNNIRLFYNDKWPPNSPIVNPIEHLWPMVTQKLRGKVFSGSDTLWEVLKEAFGSITPAQVLKLYDSMPNRLLSLKPAKLGYTRY